MTKRTLSLLMGAKRTIMNKRANAAFPPAVAALVGATIFAAILALAKTEIETAAVRISHELRSIALVILAVAFVLALSAKARAFAMREIRVLPIRWGRFLPGIILLCLAVWPWQWTSLDGMQSAFAQFGLSFFGLALLLTSRLTTSPPTRTTPFRACRTPEEDRLGFRYHAKELAKFLETERPPTFGVTGAWGSGKTSFVNLVLHYLEESSNPPVVFFNPWKSKDRVAAWHLFARALDDCFHQGAAARNPLMRVALEIAKVIPGLPVPLGDAFLDFIEHGSRCDQQALRQLESRLAHLLRGRHLFVLVDDADRAEADVTKGVFAMIDEMTQLNASCTFLFAIDRTRLKEAFCGPDAAEGFFLKILPSHHAVPPIDESQTLHWLEQHCADAPRLRSCLSNIVAVLPEGLRTKVSFVTHAASFEKIYLRDMTAEGKDWTSLFLFLLLEHQLDGFRAQCRREGIAEKLREWGVMEMFDRESREKESALQHVVEFANNLPDTGVSKEWILRATKAWFKSFDFIGSRGLNPTFVVEIGPAWIALGDEGFEAMLQAWLEAPAQLSRWAERYKPEPVSIPEAVDSFLLRALALYESSSFDASSQRYDERRRAEGEKVTKLLRAFVEWTESSNFQRDLAFLNDDRSEQLFDQFRKRPSWAIDPQVDSTSLHRQILARCAACFPVHQVARLHFYGVRDELGNEGKDDLSKKMRTVLKEIEREVHLRYGYEVIMAFHTPEGLSPKLKSDQRDGYNNSLTEPGKWFFDANVDRFRELVEESAQNEHIQDQMWRILRVILPEQDESPQEFANLLNKHPEFVKGVWNGTHLELLHPGYRAALLNRRDRAKELVPSIAEDLPNPR